MGAPRLPVAPTRPRIGWALQSRDPLDEVHRFLDALIERGRENMKRRPPRVGKAAPLPHCNEPQCPICRELGRK